MHTCIHACIYTHTQDLFSKLRLVDGHVICLLGAVKVLIYESVLMNCVPVYFCGGSVSIMTVWNNLVLQIRFSVTTVAAWAPPTCAMGRTTVEMTQMKGTVQVSTSTIISVSILEGIVTNPYICSIFYLGACVVHYCSGPWGANSPRTPPPLIT